jgi:regulator of sigma E protease
LERGFEPFEVSLIPRVSPPVGEGAMGVSLIRTAEKSYPIWKAPILAFRDTVRLTGAVISGLFDTLLSLVKGQGLPNGVHLMGPVGMGSVLNNAAKVGINYFLDMVAVLSIYMAVFNLLPIPASDGGRLLFLAIEKIKRKPINPKIEQRVNSTFFFLLIALMAWVTIKDIGNLF